jgi:hypothetical protein
VLTQVASLEKKNASVLTAVLLEEALKKANAKNESVSKSGTILGVLIALKLSRDFRCVFLCSPHS